MVELRLNNEPLPSILLSGITYRLVVAENGLDTVPATWTVSTNGHTVASGINSAVVFTPVSNTPHTITVQIRGEFGFFQTTAQTVNIVANTGRTEIGVRWSRQLYAVGEEVTAKITARAADGQAATGIAWELYRNSLPIQSGTGETIDFIAGRQGMYRLRGTAQTATGTLLFDSTVFVGITSVTRANLPIPDEGGTMVYLGSVYSQNVKGDGGTATSLPYQLGSATEEIYLLPGTTHWTFDLDPAANTLDDEVIVRTKKGNWCLNGFAGGLTGQYQAVGYDYGYMPTMIPAPLGKILNITVDIFKVHGTTFQGFNCRVRVKCYRRLPQGVYSYQRCTGSTNQPGGVGRRTRKWAALFTQMTIQTDALSTLNRLGSGTAAIAYSTDDVTSIPLMWLGTDGYPNPVQGQTGLFYTDSNLYATYAASGQPDIQAHAVAAIESVRPCCLSLLMFDNSKPVISNRISNVGGMLALYVTDGVVFKGTQVTVKIYTAGGIYLSQYTTTVAQTCYANEEGTLAKVGEIPVNLSDYQFDETGIVIDFLIDATHAVADPLNFSPVPVVSPSTIYSSTFAHTVSFDGACYTNPTYVPVFDGNAVTVTPIGGCQDTVCGPAGYYCYLSVDAPAVYTHLTQPMGAPAPYVAYANDPARCYKYVGVMASTTGSIVNPLPFYGSITSDVYAYTGTSLCGNSYLYTDCQSAYAPCGANTCSIIVIYPVSSSPHSSIAHAGRCYSFAGSTMSYGTHSVLAAANVTPTSGCTDPLCRTVVANGSVVVYHDIQTGLEVPVRFDHLSYGVPYFGVKETVVDNWVGGVVSGNRVVSFSSPNPEALFYVATGTGDLMLDIGSSNIPKQVVLVRAGQRSTYPVSGSQRAVSVKPGDQLYLRIANAYNRLPPAYAKLKVPVSWFPIPNLPRLYDEIGVRYAGASTIKAIGFTAYTSQGDYKFYGALPFTGSNTGPVNPDSIVTVSGTDGQEYMLISNHAVGDTESTDLTGVPAYQGQTLYGPFIFKFYAGRTAFGAHGEMDVWLSSNGTFPGYLNAGLYDSVKLSGTYYRKNGSAFDTHRNSYTVTTASGTYTWPRVYLSAHGKTLSAEADYQIISDGVTGYSNPFWPAVQYDAGLADFILKSDAVFNLESTWLTDDFVPWTSDSLDPWLNSDPAQI